MQRSDIELRRALRMSANRHWSGRLVVATWSLVIVLFSVFVKETQIAHALREAGLIGHVLMLTLFVVSVGSVADTAIHDFLPGRLQYMLMINRHTVTMMMGIILFIIGGGLAHTSHEPLMLVPFVLLSFFCGLFTALDINALRSH